MPGAALPSYSGAVPTQSPTGPPSGPPPESPSAPDSDSGQDISDDPGVGDHRDGEPPTVPDDIAGLGYEQARDELVSIVARLEAGQVGLEDSLALWQRGEALATHCGRWLDGAEAQLTGGVRPARSGPNAAAGQ